MTTTKRVTLLFPTLFLSWLCSAYTSVLAQESPRIESIRFLESTDADCESRPVLQSFRGVGRSLCVVIQIADFGDAPRVVLDGRDAALLRHADGAPIFAGLIPLRAAGKVVSIEVFPGTGAPARFTYALSGVETSSPILTPDAVVSIAPARPEADGSTAAPRDPALVATDESQSKGSMVILEPAEWMGEGTRAIQLAPGDSLRVHGRVFHPAGITRVLVNGVSVPLQAHPSGQMVFLTYLRADDLAKGVEIVAYPAVGEPMRKSFEEPAAMAANAPTSAQPTGINHYVDILEPKAWAGSDDRTVSAPIRRSVRVVGEAMHSSGGIRAVLIDNARASIQRLNNGAVRFIGYVPVDSRQRDVEIRVEGQSGQPIRQSYTILPDSSGDAATQNASSLQKGFRGQRWAVVVGISEYADTSIRALKYADQDAAAIYDFLRSPRAGADGFHEENILLLLNEKATYQALRSALRTFLKRSTEDDQVIIYFAGHGAPDPQRRDDFYLLAYDTKRDDIAGTGFPMADMKDAISRVLARDVLVITDACHSGALGGELAMRDLESNMINDVFLTQLNASTGGSVVFTASMANQTSVEGEQWGGGHGIFTHYILEALNGAADEDGDGIVTLIEMMEWTRDKVRRETTNAQIPNIGTTSYDQLWPMSVVLKGPVASSAPPVVRQPPASTRSGSAPSELATAREKVQLFPNSADYWNDLGEVLRATDNVSEATQAFQEAARLDPMNPARRYNLGVLLRDSGKPTAAATAFEEAVRLAPRSAEYRNALGNVLLHNNDPKRAIDELSRAMKLDPLVGRFHRDLANGLKQSGNPKAAVVEYEEAIRLEPSIARYQREYADVLPAIGRDADAIAALTAAARLDPGNPEYHEAAATALQAAGRGAESVEMYRRAIGLQPKDARLRFALGLLFRATGLQYEAIEALREAVRLAPDSAAYRFNLGEALRVSAKPEDAIPEYQAAIRQSPESAAFHHGYARALHRTRQSVAAMEEYREAIRLDASNARIRFDLASLLREAGMLDQALAEIQEAIKLDKGNVEYRTAQRELKEQQKVLARKKG